MNNPDELVDILKAVMKSSGVEPTGDVYTWEFTPVTEVTTVLTVSDIDIVEGMFPLSHQEILEFERKLAAAFRMVEDGMWDTLTRRENADFVPAKPALYEQNFKAALLDRNGKFVKRIE